MPVQKISFEELEALLEQVCRSSKGLLVEEAQERMDSVVLHSGWDWLEFLYVARDRAGTATES